MSFPLAMDEYSTQQNVSQTYTCEEIQLQLDPSILLPEFLNRVVNEAGRQQWTSDIIMKVGSKYLDELWQQWVGDWDDKELQNFAYNKIRKELQVVQEFSCVLLQRSTGPMFFAPIPFPPASFPTLVTGDTIYTPNSSCYNSPMGQFAQPVPSQGPTVSFHQDTQTFPSLQLQQRSGNPPPSNRPKCYKEEMLLNDPAEAHKWFGEFLKIWMEENTHATEYDTVMFINQHQEYIEQIFAALQGCGSMTLDESKWKKANITQKSIYFAAVQTCYTIEKRLRLGPLCANSKTGDDFRQRVDLVCAYFLMCKNSCVRLCSTSFLDEVVDNPEKMLDRFKTNCKGNASKRSRKEAEKKDLTLAVNDNQGAPATRGVRARQADPLHQVCFPPPAISGLRASRSRATRPSGGITKRRPNTRIRGRVNYVEDDENEDDEDEEEDSDDGYEQYPIHVSRPDAANMTVSAGLNIDPALLHANTTPDLGNTGDHFDIQQLQYPWA